MSRPPREIRLPGAVDLSGLRRAPAPERPPGQPAGAAPAAPPAGVIVDVTEATFEAEVVNRSLQVPVVIDFWADWCGPCKQLSPILERLATEYAGRWVLAKIDVDAEQRISQAFQIQSIPSVLAVIGGRPLPLFQGALPEDQVRQVLDEVLRVAESQGVAGQVAVEPDGDAGIPAAAPVDPGYEEAQAALDRGDPQAALAAYRALLDRLPGDPIALAGIATCELLTRIRDADERQARDRADAAPDDLDAQLLVADFDMARGEVDAAFDRLVDGVRRTAGADRDRVREHLLGLFALLDPQDARLAAARRALANALF